jgi:hypothetical protein
VIKYFRADLRIKFKKLFNDDRILIYLYHCNAQLPTGEQAFRTISDCFAWAKGEFTVFSEMYASVSLRTYGGTHPSAG